MIVLERNPLNAEDEFALAGPVERQVLLAVAESERLADQEDAWRRLHGEDG